MPSARSAAYQVTEPHPSVPSGKSAYIHAGRGGAGNYARYNFNDLTLGPIASGPASRGRISPPPSNGSFTTGRGGAGNTFSRRDSQRAMFSFDEELERQAKVVENASRAPVYHIGRGGAGNAIEEMKPVQRQGSATSASSTGSSASEKVRRSLGDVVRSLSRTVSRQ